MINPHHLHDYVVAPVLKTLGMDSPSARAIVMGTAAKESGLQHLYWKRYYNTPKGAGAESEFVSAFRLVEKALAAGVTL